MQLSVTEREQLYAILEKYDQKAGIRGKYFTKVG